MRPVSRASAQCGGISTGVRLAALHELDACPLQLGQQNDRVISEVRSGLLSVFEKPVATSRRVDLGRVCAQAEESERLRASVSNLSQHRSGVGEADGKRKRSSLFLCQKCEPSVGAGLVSSKSQGLTEFEGPRQVVSASFRNALVEVVQTQDLLGQCLGLAVSEVSGRGHLRL